VNVIKRKYVVSLVFDLVLLLVGSGMLYRLSLTVLALPTLRDLLILLGGTLIMGMIIMDVIVEAVMYKKAIGTIKSLEEFFASEINNDIEE
jgi:hypothetical protein